MHAQSSVKIPARVALLGLPGAGKTTLAQALGALSGFSTISTGAALREQASHDDHLALALARGQLAPETLVLNIVADAVAMASRTILVVDGFPRHVLQVDDADRLLGAWRALLLEIPVGVAWQRLAARMVCSNCGYVPAPLTTASGGACSRCRTESWHRREDDDRKAIAHRLSTAQKQLEQLTIELERRGTPIENVDAQARPGIVFRETRARIAAGP
jgi:adenylate kinase family enzyme